MDGNTIGMIGIILTGIISIALFSLARGGGGGNNTPPTGKG